LATTDFLDNIGKLFDGSFSGAPNKTLFGSNSYIESGESTNDIITRVQSLSVQNALPVTNRDNIFVARDQISGNTDEINKNITNLIQLGKDNDIQSDAINEQIQIREEQRAVDNANLSGLTNWVSEINERLSGQVQDLGDSQKDASGGNGINGLLDSIGGAVGISGLAVVGIIGAVIVFKVVTSR